jgi:hypothetical protein
VILTSVFGECPTTSTTSTTTTEAPFTCECHLILNESGSPLGEFGYVACDGEVFSNIPLSGGSSANICARTGSVIGNVYITVIPLGTPCLNDGDCQF